jgi:hypothetical protein
VTKIQRKTVDAEETTMKEKKRQVCRRSGPVVGQLLSENLRFFSFEENVRVWINQNPTGENQLGFAFKGLFLKK